jgi:hypothetical protein
LSRFYTNIPRSRYIAFVKSSPFFRAALSMEPEGAEQCMLKVVIE